MKGRPVIDRDLQALRSRLATINAGLLACYETIAVGQEKKARVEAKIAALASRTPSTDASKVQREE